MIVYIHLGEKNNKKKPLRSGRAVLVIEVVMVAELIALVES